MKRDDAEDALQPRGDEPKPDELDEAVEDEDADLPTLGRPNSQFPPSDKGLPDPIIVDVVIDPKPEDSLRLPFDKLSQLTSHVELFPPTLFPTKTDERATEDAEAAAIMPPLKLSLSIEGVGEVGPPRLFSREESPIVEFVPKDACITECNMLDKFVYHHTQLSYAI